QLEQDALVGTVGAGLHAFDHDAAQPAAAVVLQAQDAVDHAPILQAEVHAAHAVPAPFAFPTARSQELSLVAPEVVERPLPAHVDLLGQALAPAVGGGDDVI